MVILPSTQFCGRHWEISVDISFDKMKTKVQRGFDRDSFVTAYLVGELQMSGRALNCTAEGRRCGVEVRVALTFTFQFVLLGSLLISC